MTKKRAVSDEPIPINADYPEQNKRFFDNLFLQFTTKRWPYSTLTNFNFRDDALCSLLILSGVRAGETKLKRKQFVDLPDRVLLLNVKTQKKGKMRKEIVFPKTGMLKEFTIRFLNWLQLVPFEESYVFPSGSYAGILWDKPLSRKRVNAIVSFKTGKFPHWLRGVHETYYGKVIFKNDAWALKEHMGLIRLESTVPYVQSSGHDAIEKRLF